MSKFPLLLLAICCLGLGLIAVCTENPATIPDEKDRGGGDSIPILVIDTTTEIDSANLDTVDLNIDFSEILKGLIDSNNPDTGSGKGLGKTSSRADELVYKIKQLFRAGFTFTDSLNRSVKAEYPIDSGKCAVKMIKILHGFLYRVKVDFSGKIICPWSGDTADNIINEYFLAFDTVDLRTKSRDTLRLVLSENPSATYFIAVKNPQGKYTEGKKYEAFIKETKIQALFSDSTLKGSISCQRSDTSSQFFVTDDTGKVAFGVAFNVGSVIGDDVIEGTAKSSLDDGDGIIVGPILFEHLIPLKVTKTEPKNGGLVLYFNRVGKMSIGDSSSFKIILEGDTANIVKRTEIQGGEGCISWLPAASPKAGTYNLRVEGIRDEYENKSPLFTKVLIFK